MILKVKVEVKVEEVAHFVRFFDAVGEAHTTMQPFIPTSIHKSWGM